MRGVINMKELYIAPEVKLIGFVSSEKIAANDFIDFGNWDVSLNADSPATESTTDIRIDIIR